MPPFNTRNIHRAAYVEACNVLAGLTANGTATIPYRIPFTKDPDVRMEAGRLIMSIGHGCDIGFYGDPEDRTALFVKVLSHLNKRGIQSLPALKAFRATDKDLIAQAIRHNHHLLKAPINIQGIIRIYRQQEATAANAAFTAHLADAPARAILWQSTDGKYRLEEVTDPRHLVQETQHLGHCAGREFCSGVPKHIRLRPLNPEALPYLQYWRMIKNGRTRFLSLTDHGQPVASIDFYTRSRTIEQIWPVTPPVTVEMPFFAVLCSALHAIRHELGIIKIQELPSPPPGTILTARGTFEPPSSANIGEALAAPDPVMLPADATLDDVHTYARASLITLDLTLVPQDKLDALSHVRARLLFTGNGPLSLPNLEQAIEISAKAATTARFPKLATGDVIVTAATEVELPFHETGEIKAGSALRLDLPRHGNGHVSANSAATFSAPRHWKGWIDARSATALDLPCLRNGSVDAPNALHVNLPVHINGTIYAGSATSLHAPRHKTGSVDARSVTHDLDFPEFTEGSLMAFHARTLSIPKHHDGHIIVREDAAIERPTTATVDVFRVSTMRG